MLILDVIEQCEKGLSEKQGVPMEMVKKMYDKGSEERTLFTTTTRIFI